MPWPQCQRLRIQNHLARSWLADIKIWLTKEFSGRLQSGRDADEHAVKAVIV